MKKVAIALGALAALAVTTTAALADGAKNFNDPRATSRAFGGTYAPNARLVAVIRGSTVYQSKAVASYTHPTTGVYCIVAKSSLLNPNNSVGVATVEWGHSSGFDLLAYWWDTMPSGSFDCPANNWEVRTYDFAAGGSPVLSDDVAFILTVP